MTDPLSALIQYLKADTGIITLAGTPSPTRVFGLELPQNQSASMPRKAVVLKFSGGPGKQPHADLSEQRIDIWCYGETAFEAMKLQLAVSQAVDTLRRKAEGTTFLHGAIQSGGLLGPIEDPDTNWVFCLQSWLLSYGTAAIA